MGDSQQCGPEDEKTQQELPSGKPQVPRDSTVHIPDSLIQAQPKEAGISIDKIIIDDGVLSVPFANEVTVKLSGKPIEDNRGGATFLTDMIPLMIPCKNESGQIERYDRVDGRFDFIKRLGGGGFGDVYLAKDKKVNRDVAIKVCKPGPAYEQTFKREIEILKQAEVKGIVRMYDTTTVRVKRMTDDLKYVLSDEICDAYVMEFIPGMPLSDVIKKYFSGDSDMRAAWSRVRFLQEFVELAKAVQFLHNSGVIHRDLKPDNVYVSDRNEIKLLDLGLAKTVKETSAGTTQSGKIRYDDSLNSMEAGGVAGTPSWMSPEQVMGQPLDERSDVYALGAILYAMMAGEGPLYKMPANENPVLNSLEYWQALICRGEIESVNTLIAEHNKKIQKDFADADEKLREEARNLEIKEVDPVLELIIMSALRKDKRQRYQNIGEMLVDIKDYFDGNFHDIQARAEKRLLDENTQVYGRRDAAHVMESEIAVLTEKIKEAEGRKKFALAAQLRIDAATKCLELGNEYILLNKADNAARAYSQSQEFVIGTDRFMDRFAIDAKRTKNRAQHGKALVAAIQKKYDEAISLTRDALTDVEQLGDKERKVNMLMHIARCYIDKSDSDNTDSLHAAKEYALQALDLAVEIDFKHGIVSNLGMLVAYALVANDVDTMNSILRQKDYWTAKVGNDPVTACHLHKRFAEIYLKRCDETLTLEHGRLALKLGELVQDEGVIFGASKILGTLFCETGQPEQAIPYLKRAYQSKHSWAKSPQQNILELCEKYHIPSERIKS